MNIFVDVKYHDIERQIRVEVMSEHSEDLVVDNLATSRAEGIYRIDRMSHQVVEPVGKYIADSATSFAVLMVLPVVGMLLQQTCLTLVGRKSLESGVSGSFAESLDHGQRLGAVR
jgi:hypothetical protein